MRFFNVIVVVLLAALAGYFGGKLGQSRTVVQAESTYDRVMRTGVLRCGYAVWPPTAIFKDANTGQLAGIFPEIIEEMGKNLNIKIEWVEETGWANFVEAMQMDRFDMFCGPIWPTTDRAKLIGFTVPVAYSAGHIYSRKDDTRFDADYKILNDAQYTIATMDGEMSAIMAAKAFPKAKTVAIPQLGDMTQMLMSVVTGKADATILEPSLAREFSQKNPGTIHQVTKEPYAIYPDVYGVKLDDVKFKAVVDAALTQMVNEGVVDQIIEKYETDRGMYMPVSKPYSYVAPQPLQ